MRISEKHITEAQLKEMAGLFLYEKAMIGLDIQDLKSVLEGKEGILYVAQNDDNEDNRSFMKHVFDELTKKEEVKACTNLLINIGMAEDCPLIMDDMNTLNELFESFDNEEMEIRWGIKPNDGNTGMTIQIICTRNTKSE